MKEIATFKAQVLNVDWSGGVLEARALQQNFFKKFSFPLDYVFLSTWAEKQGLSFSLEGERIVLKKQGSA